MSNFFAKYSPDGKWIVFCKAKSFMLLQPDSLLYIIPAEGGEARKLRCNTTQMNSWHSWSPNGKWLVFSSKQNSPYTQLFLTHIDDEGNSTPPVVLSNLTAADRAANIPEFVNLQPNAIRGIRERFVDDVSYVRAAHEFKTAGDFDNAMASLRKALEINPRNPQACFDVAWLLEKSGDVDQAVTYYEKSIEYDPTGADAYSNLGVLLNKRKDYKEGIANLTKTLELQPNNPQANYNLALAGFELKRIDPAIRYAKEAIRLKPDYVEAQTILGVLLMENNMLKESAECLSKAISLDSKNVVAYYNLGLVMARAGDVNRAGLLFAQVIKLDPNHADAHYDLGRALVLSRKIDEGIRYYSQGLRIRPNLARDPAFFDVLRAAGPTPAQYQQAIAAVEQALGQVETAQNAPLAKEIADQLRIYKQAGPR
jgi:tetratricopeptide (TPR) repeat protein